MEVLNYHAPCEFNSLYSVYIEKLKFLSIINFLKRYIFIDIFVEKFDPHEVFKILFVYMFVFKEI